MKILYIMIIFLFFSCIDLLIHNPHFNSFNFNGGSWIEFGRLDNMKMSSTVNDFTLQFLISGGDIDTNESPALFSLINTSNEITLSLLRDPNKNNNITTILNSKIYKEDIDNLDFSNPDSFYLVSILFSDKSNTKILIDSTLLMTDINIINIKDETLAVGGMVNESRTIIENFWYGYIDEIRLWNTVLSDSTIKFQVKNFNKFSNNYRETGEAGEKNLTYLDSLIGLWRLNYNESVVLIEDESGNKNDGNIYTLSGYNIELSEKGKE